MIPIGVLASSYIAPAGGGGFEYLAGAVDTASASTHTFAGVTLGEEDAARTIVVAVTHRGGNTSTVTIGGVSATLDQTHAGGSTTIATVCHATVPAGTTGDVVVTHAGTSGCAVGVYRIGGAVTVASADPVSGVVLSTQAGDFCVTAGITTSATMTLSGGTIDYFSPAYSGVYGFAGSTTAEGTSVFLGASSTFAMSGVAYRLA